MPSKSRIQEPIYKDPKTEMPLIDNAIKVHKSKFHSYVKKVFVDLIIIFVSFLQNLVSDKFFSNFL